MKTTIAVFGKNNIERSIAETVKDAEIIDIRDFPQIPEDTERFGIVCPTINGNVPYEVEDYIRNEIGVRDNSNLKYIFGILTYEKSPLWVESQLSRALSDAGCVLSYVNRIALNEKFSSLENSTLTDDERRNIVLSAEPKMTEILKDIENEEFRLAKYSLLYRIFRRFGRNKRPAET